MALELNIKINSLPSAKSGLRYTVFDKPASSSEDLITLSTGEVDVLSDGQINIPFELKELGDIVGVLFEDFDGTNSTTSKSAFGWVAVSDDAVPVEPTELKYAPRLNGIDTYMKLSSTKVMSGSWYIEFDMYLYNNTTTSSILGHTGSGQSLAVHIDGSSNTIVCAIKQASGTWVYSGGAISLGYSNVRFSYDESNELITSSINGTLTTKTLTADSYSFSYVGKNWNNYPPVNAAIYNLDLNGDLYEMSVPFSDYPYFTGTSGGVISGYYFDVDDIVEIIDEETAQSIDKSPYAYELEHHISYGQSLSLGAVGNPVISTFQPYQNLTFRGGVTAGDDGILFYPLIPLVENNDPGYGTTTCGESPCSSMTNEYVRRIVENGGDAGEHVILSTAPGHGAYPIANLDKNSAWYVTFTNHIQRAMYSQESYKLTMVHWAQGENDGDSTYDYYYAAQAQLFADMQADYEAITGNANQIIFVTYQCYGYETNSTGRAVARAQLDLVRDNENIILSTPVYHLPMSQFPHLTAEGYYRMGAHAGRAYYNAVYNNDRALPIDPSSLEVTGNVIKVVCDVVTPPLKINTTDIIAASNYGFVVKDDGVTASISSVAISSDGLGVEITMQSAVVGEIEVRYVLDNQLRGNITDSNNEVVTMPNGNTATLFNVCPMFSLSATIDDGSEPVEPTEYTYTMDGVNDYIDLNRVALFAGDAIEFDYSGSGSYPPSSGVGLFFSDASDTTTGLTHSASGAMNYANLSNVTVDGTPKATADTTDTISSAIKHFYGTATVASSIRYIGVRASKVGYYKGVIKNLRITRANPTTEYPNMFFPINDGFSTNPTIKESLNNNTALNGTAYNFSEANWS